MHYLNRMERLHSAKQRIESKSFTPKQLNAACLKVNEDGTRRNGFQLLSFPNIDFDTLVRLDADLSDVDSDTRVQLEKDALYANYIERQNRDVEMMKRDEAHIIPKDFDFNMIAGLSAELKSKLDKARPENLAQAGRIDGMTPAALTLLLALLRQQRRLKSA